MNRLLQIAMLVLVAGCVERKLTVTSDPPGALVYLNDREIGRTPVTRDFTFYGNYDVAIRKDGYETLKTSAKVNAPIWQWVPFDFFAELIPWRTTDKQSLHFTLKESTTQPVDAGVLHARAVELREMLQSSDHTRKPTTQPTQP